MAQDMRSHTPTRNTRAHTSPWPPTVDTAPRPALKKRHSAYALSNSPVLPSTLPPIPHLPILPPRHPSRLNSPDSKQQPRKSRSRRPSTATGSSADVTPLEGTRKSFSDVHSVQSRTSSLGFTPTGPVEEVTPWELHPLPTSSEGLKASPISGYLKSYKSSSLISIPPSPHKSTLSTGPVEEVTPWELLPGPSQNGDKPASPVSLKKIYPHPISPPHPPLSNLDRVTVTVYPRATATGPTEDVTPWELTPAPVQGQDAEVPLHVGLSRTRSSLSLTMAQLEQVTPWELYPAPRSNGSNLSAQTQMPPQASSSEVGYRTRKSTGSRSSKATRSPIHAIGILNIPPLPIESTISTGQQKGTGSAKVGRSPTVTSPASASSSKQPQPSYERQDLKFSTADRTILEQLKMSIRAKEAQFVVKGIGNSVVGGGKSPGKKHHSYSAKEVPYPRSYGREIVDLDVWETMFCLDICESLTWHDLETPPTKVLDLGCGTGTWILHCAQNWKECHFVGLDIVPLHPDLQNVGSPDLASRITWVQHNFLDGLPFQNEEFDFVHIKRIALGVPEDKWDKFFEEIVRVMKPGAAFEMVEEDLFFPGKCIDDNEEDSIGTTNSSSCWNSASPDHRRGSPGTPTTTSAHEPRSAKKENGKEVMVNEEQISFDSFPSPSLPALSVSVTTAPTTAIPMPFPTMPKEPNPISPLYRSTTRPVISVQTEQSHSESGIINPAGHGSSSASLLSTVGTVNDTSMSRTRSSSVQTSTTTGSKLGASLLNLGVSPDSDPKPTTKPSPFLLRMLTHTPTNPRDHTLLETIWNEMLSSRWVNLSPLSLLTTYLEWHFKDVRTHPPVMYTFPPAAPKPEPADDDDDSESDVDFVAYPHSESSVKSNNSGDKGKPTEEHRWLPMQSPKQQSSPYVTLDGTRGTAYPPSHQANAAVFKARETPTSKRMSRLPTSTLNIDLRTLNLHLALRAQEILACSESMWEWVEEFQRTSETSVPSLTAPNNCSSDVTRCTILEMTRDDFDHLLNNFALDFQDQAAVGYALQEQFNWHVFPSRRLQDRKIFDKACKKYQKWVLAERMKSSLQCDHKLNGTTGTRHSFSAPNVDQNTHPIVPITRSHSIPQAGFKDDGPTLTHVSSHISDPGIQSSPLSCPLGPDPTTQLAPTQRLSRSMRVFVAWKASL